MFQYISLISPGWIAIRKLYNSSVKKINVIISIMTCNSPSKALLECESKVCSCPQRKKDSNKSSESNSPPGGKEDSNHDELVWRRHCGCIRTSEKLRHILKSFPSPPPPSPAVTNAQETFQQETCVATYCAHAHASPFPDLITYCAKDTEKAELEELEAKKRALVTSNKWWQVVTELVQLVQLSVTATALALYYLIYCYMQLVYYTLRSAIYFHNADGPMKITIAVVTLTSLVIGFNLVLRMERLVNSLLSI